MRCPTLTELPPPPPDKTGWPWTEEIPLLPDKLPDSSSWPRISIITPSYNQGRFIEETIRSILLQGYPELEYIIIDGSSVDDSVEIIHKYEPWLTYWISEPDHGQSYAINKGLNITTGNLIAWLNSDDIYLPGTLATIARIYLRHPNQIIAGPVINYSQNGNNERIIYQKSITGFEEFLKFWSPGWTWHQPGIFFPEPALKKVGGLDSSLHFCMDYDLILRLLQITSSIIIDRPLVRFRLHDNSKTNSGDEFFLREWIIVSKRYLSSLDLENIKERDSFVSRKFALLIGKRIKQCKLSAVLRVFVIVHEMKITTKVFLMFLGEFLDWIKWKLGLQKYDNIHKDQQ